MVLQRSSTTARFSADALAADDLVDGLDAAGGADPARRALAAGFDGAELHRKARLFRHVDAVVEHDDAGMADQAVACGKRLIVERRIEQRARKVRAERSADLHGANRAAARSAAADIVDQFAERDAEGGFEQAAVFDVAGKLDRHGAARASHAVIGIGFCAIVEDEGDRRERQHVVDDGRLAEQALVRRQRRLCAHDAAAAFEAFQQRGLLAADIGAGADADFDIEAVGGAADFWRRDSRRASPPRSPRSSRRRHADIPSGCRCSPWWRRR